MFHLHARVHPQLDPLSGQYTPEELADFRQLFAMFDTDGSGAIGNDELRQAMLSNGLSASQEDIDSLIREVDADGNGEIDFSEFCACMKKTQTLNRRSTIEDLTRQCFDVFDIDKDGLITEAEFKYIAKKVGGFTDELADFVFHELDVTGSGCLNTDQFLAIVEDYLGVDAGASSQRSEEENQNNRLMRK